LEADFLRVEPHPSMARIRVGNKTKLATMASNRVTADINPKAWVPPKSEKAKMMNPKNKMMEV
jgi:hypothetical protein